MFIHIILNFSHFSQYICIFSKRKHLMILQSNIILYIPFLLYTSVYFNCIIIYIYLYICCYYTAIDLCVLIVLNFIFSLVGVFQLNHIYTFRCFKTSGFSNILPLSSYLKIYYNYYFLFHYS